MTGDELERVRALRDAAEQLAERIGAALDRVTDDPVASADVVVLACLVHAQREANAAAGLLAHAIAHVLRPEASQGFGSVPCSRCGHPLDDHRTPGAECAHVTGRDAQGETHCQCASFK